MGAECATCERDLRGSHADDCPKNPCTAWFDGGKFVPSMPGVYECEWSETGAIGVDAGVWFNYWTGSRWRWGSETPERAAKIRSGSTTRQPVRWRGLKTPNCANQPQP